jgi:hypothetical protein
MFGTLAAVAACAGLVAGCGGSGGHTAAESAPTSTTPAPAAAAAPAAPGPLGAFAQSDPVTGRDQTFASYQRFPKNRAGKIFVDPNEPPPAPAAPVATAAAGSAVTTVPLSPTAPTGAATSALPTPVAVTTQLSASLDISGVVQTVVVGDAVPAAAPQFTVQAITSTTVTLKPNSGSLPGGSTTLDLAVGKAVTLSNPSTKANLVINVVEIKSQV